jgi:hypothetical protein
MKDEVNIVTPALREIILTPMEARLADWTPIRDEKGEIILDEQGLPICEG